MWLWRNPDNITHRQLLSIDQIWRRHNACLHEADEAAIDWLTTLWLLAHDNNNATLDLHFFFYLCQMKEIIHYDEVYVLFTPSKPTVMTTSWLKLNLIYQFWIKLELYNVYCHSVDEQSNAMIMIWTITTQQSRLVAFISRLTWASRHQKRYNVQFTFSSQHHCLC